MTNYKEVFQLAQDKGYMLRQESTDNGTILYNTEIEKYIELTLIQKWLRDEKGIDIEVKNQYTDPFQGKWYYATIFIVRSRTTPPTTQDTTYEQALLQGINEALKLL